MGRGKDRVMTEYQRGMQIIQDMITKRWVPEILCSLSNGNNTYTKILNSIEFLSDTELQRKLKILCSNQCIIRDQELGIYSLTEYGREINHLFQHFYDLGKRHQRI